MLAVALGLAGCASRGTLDPATELPVSCMAKPDPGPCRAVLTRYYYDYRDNRCKPFAYGGCQGRVPFESARECIEFCGAEPDDTRK